MHDLDEMQFELLPSAEAQDGVPFGIGLDVSIPDAGFDPGTEEWVTQDTDDQARGVTHFGKDFLQGPTWIWSMFTNREDTVEALASLGELKTAWRGLAVVNTPGANAAMRYRVGDRVRRVYGRPRRFSAPPDNKILFGQIPITADFKCVDAYTYADEATTVTLTPQLGPPPSIVFPLVFPIHFTPAVPSTVAANVGGDAATYPFGRIEGPVTNPYIQTDRWTMTINTTLLDDDYIDFDLRPWVGTIVKNGTESVAGLIGRKQWLEDMFLLPGENTFAFGGTSSSSGATALVSWRDAYNSL